MYKKTILEDIRNATSSPESAGGASHLNSPDGRKIDPYGQEVVPASHTVQQENREEMQTSETSGLPSSTSSRSVALNSCLESRLKTRFATGGSIEYTQTWKEKSTPSGRLYLAHTASERHIADTGSTGEVSAWTTPTSREFKDGSPSNVPINRLGRVVWQVFLPGETVSSFSAGMGKLVGYRLNPYFSGWLMGFPKAWTEAGLRAFRKLKASRSQKKRKDE